MSERDTTARGGRESGSAGRLLIVDDEPDVMEVLKAVGESRGWLVRAVADSRTAADVAREFGPDRIIMDIVMPEMDGFEVLDRLAVQGCGAEILLLSGFSGLYGKLASAVGAAAGLRVAFAAKPIALGALDSFLNEGCQMPERTDRSASRNASLV